MNSLLSETTHTLLTLYDAFTALGRLTALKALCLAQLHEKHLVINKAQQFIENAYQIATLLNRAYAIKTHHVTWHTHTHPTKNLLVDANNIIEPMAFHHAIDKLTAAAQFTLQKSISQISRITHLQPVLQLLRQLKQSLHCNTTTDLPLKDILGEPIASNSTDKVLQGPAHIDIDNIFLPTHSVLEEDISEYGNSATEAAPYYWGLSAFESVAADMCCLSIIEYDNFPIQFYRDMAKQAWDEIRHAILFLEMAISLLAELKNQLETDNPLLVYIKGFEKTGRGLPIPLERNLYEALWNATLEERLILMHHDAETPAISRLKEKMLSTLSAKHSTIRDGLEIVMREEITHARLGKKWLQYILPDPKMRTSVINRTRMLRSLLLLTSVAYHRNEPLSELIHDTLAKHRTK